MSRRIAYIELDTHAEILANLMKLSEGSEDFLFTFFISEKIAERLSLQHCPENVNIVKPRELLKKINSQSFDLVIIGTAHRNFNIYQKISKKNKTAIIVHNLNFSQSSGFRLFSSVFKKEQLFRLKLLFLEGLLRAPRLYQNADFQLVLDKEISGERQMFFSIFYRKNQGKTSQMPLRIVVPGQVSQQRRDYRRILKKMEDFRLSWEFIFLGKAEGEELGWIRKAEKLMSPRLKLRFFTQKVSQENFDRLLNSASVLWCPLQSETEFFSIREIYGRTKMSGNLGDAISAGRPAIFPENYPENDYPFILRESAEVENQLVNASAEDFSGFEFSEVRKEFIAVLSRLLAE